MLRISLALLSVLLLWISPAPEAGREEGRKEGVEEGRKEGVEEGAKASIEMLQELGISREEVQTKVQEKFLASDEIVKEWMSKYWK